MNTHKNRQEWIDALRSERYMQGRIHLKYYEDGGDEVYPIYCPWGVACEIYHGYNPKTTEWSEPDPYEEDVKLYDTGRCHFWVERYNNDLDCTEKLGCIGLPIEEILDFFGSNNDEMSEIIDMNDWQDKTFEEIAEYIEKGKTE